MVSGIGLGGFADGLRAGSKTALDQQTQSNVEEQQKRAELSKLVETNMAQIQNIFKETAAAGGDVSKLADNPAIQAHLQYVNKFASALGQDPAIYDARVRTMALAKPAEDDTKHTIVQIGENTNGLNTTKKYGRLEVNSGEITPLGPDGQLVTGTSPQPQLSQSDVIPPAQAQRVNPGQPPAVAVAPISAPAAPDGTPAQRVAMGFPPQDQGAAPAPAGPTLPPNMQPGTDAINYAINNNIHGPEFAKALPPQERNIVQGISEYKIAPESVSKKNNYQAIYQGWARQLTNGEYDPKWYKPMQAAIKEFTSGGQTSPAGQITVGNTAIAHGAQVADAIDKLKAVPGLLSRMEKSDTPFVSYAASALKNQSIRGTSEGAALSAFLTASHHFVDETTKFYAGGQPAEAGRERGLENFNGAKSETELYQALNSEAELLSGKVDALQDRWKTAVAGPKALGDLLLRNAIPDFPVLSEKSKASLDRIGQGYIAIKFKNGQQSGDNVQTGAPVDYQTYFGTK